MPTATTGYIEKASVFVGSLLLVSIPGLVAGQISSASVWYRQPIKPDFVPPAQLLGPIWSLLYILMALAAYRAWEKEVPGEQRRQASFIYLTQLTLSTLWTPLFFGLHSIPGGLAVIGALIPITALNIAAFYRLDRFAGWLLIPYLLWLIYSGALIATILYVNHLEDVPFPHLPIACQSL